MLRSSFTIVLLLMVSSTFAQKFYLFVGTYTDKGSKGIYVYEFDAATGQATKVSNTEGTVNPSYLAVSHDHKFVYAVTETAKQNAGSVSAFRFDRTTGTLTFLNKQLSGGDNPCYVSVHKSDKWIAVGNYSGGSLSVFPVNADGSLKPLAQNIQHTGKGVNAARQEQPHVHSTVFSPDYNYLFVPDLGTDKVVNYTFDTKAENPLTPATPPFEKVDDGNGPRHLTFHPNEKFAYLVEEMSGTVAAYQYSRGKLTFIQRINAHPADYKGALGGADIHLSPDGKFLYASNRGDENTIAIFSVDTRSGKLTAKGYSSTNGRTPRNFTIDPTGNYLLVANQATNNIVVFKRDKKTGLIQPFKEEISVPTPVCLQMISK